MTIKRRIGLIIAGLVVFAVTGPVIIFIAQGYSYDFEQNRLVSNGTLVVKTEPRGAIVRMDGQDLKNTPLTKRFIHPGEYLVEISKDGYRPWQKRVTIFPGQVAFLTSQNEKIDLFLERPEELQIVDQVADIFPANNSIFYIDETGQKIYRQTFSNTEPVLVASTTTALPQAKFIDAITRDGEDEFLLSSEGENWYVSEQLTGRLPKLSSINFGQTAGTVLGINAAQELVEIMSNVTRVLAKKNVSAFRPSGSEIYYLGKSPSGETWLYRTNSISEESPLTLLPAFTSSQIIVSPQNQVYLLLDRELYEVNETLQKLRNNVSFGVFDNNGDFLLYGNDHETWIYTPAAAPANRLLIRSTTPASAPRFHKATGYTFLIEGNQIKAVESDDSGQPNVYSLLAGLSPQKITLNEEGNVIAILDGPTLKLIKIR